MRIYIAGALSSKEKTDRTPSQVVTDYISNVHKMCKVASEVAKLGHAPFVPALDFLLGVTSGDWGENIYRSISLSFLEVCDAILIISMSHGVQVELNFAHKLNMPVYYSVETLPVVENK